MGLRPSPIGVAVFLGVIFGAFVFGPWLEPWLGRYGGILVGVVLGYAIERGWRIYQRRATAVARVEAERSDEEPR